MIKPLSGVAHNTRSYAAHYPITWMHGPDVPDVVHVDKACVLRSFLDLVEQNRSEVASRDHPVIHSLIVTPLSLRTSTTLP